MISHIWRGDTEIARGARPVVLERGTIDQDQDGVVRSRHLSEVP